MLDENTKARKRGERLLSVKNERREKWQLQYVK
jgi:hypothetical protein